MRLLQLILAAQLIVLYGTAKGQDIISLTDIDMQRLGLVFAELQSSSGEQGVAVPARIIHAPAADTALRANYSGVLTQWHVNSGEQLVRGARVATIRSQGILVLQQQWLDSVVALQEHQFLVEKDKTLLAEGIISRLRLEQAERAFARAENAEKSARESLIQAGMNEDDLAVLRTEKAIGLYNIRARQDGVLSHRAVITGEYIEAGTMIGSVAGSQVWLQAGVPGRLAMGMRQGQLLRVPGTNTSLTLMQKDLEIDPATQTVDIMACFDGVVSFVPGQLVSLIIPPVQTGVLIPAEAVVHSEGAAVVFVRTGSGVEIRPLSLIPLGADYLADSGISAGEQVVVRGAAIVKGIQFGLGGE